VPGGRPTKYTPELLKKAESYLETYKDEGDEIPSIVGLARTLQISRETIHAWRHENDKRQFSDILGDILSEQERVLLNNGLNGTFNSNIVKLTLGKHGYHDKTDNTHTGKSGGPMQWEVMDAKTPNT